MAYENVDFSKGNYETKSSELADQMRNVEFYLKEATVITPYSCSRLQQDCLN